MKCLSLQQTFAELLVSGKKTIELRKWNTKFRGKFLIHASKSSLNIDYAQLCRGAIIGTAELFDVEKLEGMIGGLSPVNSKLTLTKCL